MVAFGRMENVMTVLLSRDCDAVQIPAGNTVVLPAGTEVDITQRLGGSYTVRALGGLFRVGSKDGDALGIAPEASPTAAAAVEGDVDEKMVWETLRSCYDPEIPVNIVDLGLVYDMGIDAAPGGKKVFVKMTLTAPGCGMGATIAGDAQQRILCLPGVVDASVEIVWDPPWHQSMITPEGRRLLGIE